jgi:hypothetical protein
MTTATWADLEGRGGTEAADRQRALAEGGSCGERLVAHKSGREGGREREIAIGAMGGREREREGEREIRLAGWNGPGGLGIDSCLY